jgi:nicotinate-nucleotide pyrophosphorylase (carboxylating)
MTLAQIVAAALAEDLGPGDVTSRACLPADRWAQGRLVAKEAGVLSGLAAAVECFQQVDSQLSLTPCHHEGDPFEAGEMLARVAGPARSLLAAERVTLNFMQRLSGTATLTAEYVRRVAGTRARIVDTRKTTPGLRLLQKAAVRHGGGYNHRWALYDGILIKDNHLAVAGGVRAAVQAARASAPHTLRIEVEVTNLDELTEAITAGADIVLLDNMTVEQLQQAVERAAGQVLLEASGGVRLETVAAIAATGVDYISVGALTHSAPAIDLSLQFTDL